jgi:CubicO group peptidase (beta-lactamase class C family)
LKKIIVVFLLLTILFVAVTFVVKSRYYYYPYPNLVDYVLALALAITIAISLTIKSKVSTRVKVLIGAVSIIVLLASINIMNLVCEWHPPILNLPFTKSQSFEVGYEPYEWQTAPPAAHGYNEEALTAYFNTLHEWERLRAVLVVKDGKLIVEKYFEGATKYSAFNVHSVTKSVTAALVGLAIKHDYIKSEHELILPFFPEYEIVDKKRPKHRLTIKHLLSMRGGWAGGDGAQTVAQCILTENLHKEPGTEFKYFTGSQNILSAIITKSTKQSTKAFADEYLFAPLGIQNAFWRKHGGYYCGGDESYFTARDLARFGKLYLDKGNVDGKQLVDSAWIEKSFTSYTDASKEFRSLKAYDEVGYGLCWWLFKIKDGKTIYSARGKGGQHIMLVPEKNMVVVLLQEWNPLIKKAELEDRMLTGLLGVLFLS